MGRKPSIRMAIEHYQRTNNNAALHKIIPDVVTLCELIEELDTAFEKMEGIACPLASLLDFYHTRNHNAVEDKHQGDCYICGGDC